MLLELFNCVSLRLLAVTDISCKVTKTTIWSDLYSWRKQSKINKEKKAIISKAKTALLASIQCAFVTLFMGVVFLNASSLLPFIHWVFVFMFVFNEYSVIE